VHRSSFEEAERSRQLKSTRRPMRRCRQAALLWRLALIDDAGRENLFGMLMSLNMLIESGTPSIIPRPAFHPRCSRPAMSGLVAHTAT
jgi:hypothetical protein